LKIIVGLIYATIGIATILVGALTANKVAFVNQDGTISSY